MAQNGSTERVRKTAAELYIHPARRRGDKQVVIHSGQLNRALVERKLIEPNRFPIVCNALRSKKFAIENGLTLQEVKTSARSGQSSTVAFHFGLGAVEDDITSKLERFERLRGLLRDTYKKLGGAEHFHRAERESWER